MSFVVVRCLPLRRALCLITKKSVDYGFSLFPRLIGFVFVGKLASAGAVFRTSILWRWNFRESPQAIFRQARG
ncbi:hypothetical protein F0D70_18180 [Vibrio cholerae]|nr:hypothetical protein [Vibrio cholerae]